MSNIVNYRGKCRHLLEGQVGGACWLPKGHHGPHSFWIYRWKRRPGDARRTVARLAQERRDRKNERARDRRSEKRWLEYNRAFNYIPKDY